MQKIFSLRGHSSFFFVKSILIIMISFAFIRGAEGGTSQVTDFPDQGPINQSRVLHGLGQGYDDEDLRRRHIFSDQNSIWAYSLFSSVGVGVALSTLFGDLEDNLYAMIPCVLGCMIGGGVVGFMIKSGMPNHHSMTNYSHLMAFMASLFPWVIVCSLEYARFQSNQSEVFSR